MSKGVNAESWAEAKPSSMQTSRAHPGGRARLLMPPALSATRTIDVRKTSKTAAGGRQPPATTGRAYRFRHAETDGLEDESDSVLPVVFVLKSVGLLVEKGVDSKFGATPWNGILRNSLKPRRKDRSRYTVERDAKKGGDTEGSRQKVSPNWTRTGLAPSSHSSQIAHTQSSNRG